jgi:hypothetical protein
VRIRAVGERWLGPADDRRHAIAGAGVVVGRRPRISTRFGVIPTSSSASRKAVCSGVPSPSSTRPPGKLICPA